MIVEGIHILPGALKKSLLDEPNVFIYILKVEDEKEHKQRLEERGYASRRQAKQYIDNFETIREIQSDILNKAKIHDIPTLESEDVYKTVRYLTEDVMTRMVEMM